MAGATAVVDTHELVESAQVQQNHPSFPEDASCRYCHVLGCLRTDFSQGDRVCTNCGIVDTEKLLDSGPEWRDYDNDETLFSHKARSGLVAIDESRYIGGLQPTTVSKYLYGGGSGGSDVRKRLIRINRRMDKIMERNHQKMYHNTAISIRLRQKREQNNRNQQIRHPMVETDTDTVNTENKVLEYDRNLVDDGEEDVDLDGTIIPELERKMLHQQSQLTHHKNALQADKWSLHRAKEWNVEVPEDDEIDDGLLQAAHDLYAAYEFIMAASRKLHLPLSISDEAGSLLSQYASKRDGLKVKGVATAMNASPKFNCDRKNVAYSGKKLEKKRCTKSDSERELAERNKNLQMASLGAALLFWVARYRQRPRSLASVCESFSVQRKQCSSAMKALKEYVPVLSTTIAKDPTLESDTAIPHTIEARHHTAAIDNKPDTSMYKPDAVALNDFTQQALQKLNLPIVAEASVRCLVLNYLTRGENHSEIKRNTWVTVCAAVAFFVCSAGGTIQTLASQSKSELTRKAKPRPLRCQSSDFMGPAGKRPKIEMSATETKMKNTGKPFDIFDTGNSATAILEEQRAYEMQRFWDAWSEQRPWSRTLNVLEQCTGVSKTVIWEFYKARLFPNRQALLSLLSDASESKASLNGHAKAVSEEERAILNDAPLASILLPHISVAATIMKADACT
jgi:transcription initiation factor TFIIIB Brf1 subunit/transcription initiation factor TFIIB